MSIQFVITNLLYIHEFVITVLQLSLLLLSLSLSLSSLSLLSLLSLLSSLLLLLLYMCVLVYRLCLCGLLLFLSVWLLCFLGGREVLVQGLPGPLEDLVGGRGRLREEVACLIITRCVCVYIYIYIYRERGCLNCAIATKLNYAMEIFLTVTFKWP